MNAFSNQFIVAAQEPVIAIQTYKRPSASRIANQTCEAYLYAAAFADDYLETFFHVLVFGTNPLEDTVFSNVTTPRIFAPHAHLLCSYVSITNISINALINIDNVVGYFNITYLSIVPFTDQLVEYVAAWCAVQPRFVNTLFIFGDAIDPNFASARVIVGDSVTYFCDFLEISVAAVFYSVAALWEFILGFFSDFFEGELAFTNFRTILYPQNIVPLFPQYRQAARSVGCLFSVYVPPLGNAIRSILYVLIDLVQIILEILLAVANIVDHQATAYR